MSLTEHVGYGRFRLDDLLPGEECARADGSRAKVCEEQPYRQSQGGCNQPFLPHHVWVWIDYGTSNARRVFLHRTALVHALSPEQAQAIQKRHQQRKEPSP